MIVYLKRHTECECQRNILIILIFYLYQIQEFFADKLDTLGPGRAAYESALQSIRGNIAWREEHESAVEEAAVPSIWEDIRLPTNVVPSHYDVKLKIDMTNERFTGELF